MRRRAFAGLAAAAMAATLVLTAAPAAQAEDWCDVDPLVKVDMPDGRKEHVHVTLGAVGEVHKQSLQRATITSDAGYIKNNSEIEVTIKVTVPQDGKGAFKTRAMASTGPHGEGTVRAEYTEGYAGSAIELKYTLKAA